MIMNLGRLKARLNPPDFYEGIIRPLRRGDKINATYVSGITSRDLVAHVSRPRPINQIWIYDIVWNIICLLFSKYNSQSDRCVQILTKFSLKFTNISGGCD